MDENELSHEIIGAAIEVHRVLGPGMLEFIYEEALVIELEGRGREAMRQVEVEVSYKSKRLENKLRLDMLIDGIVIVEIKSVERILPIHESQLLTYLRLADKKLGLLINFNSVLLRNSIRRVVNKL